MQNTEAQEKEKNNADHANIPNQRMGSILHDERKKMLRMNLNKSVKEQSKKQNNKSPTTI